MVLQSIKMALKAIFANKTRSFLTMLGIIIGVFSLVVLVSIVDGATSFITSTIDDLGSDYVEVAIRDDKGKTLYDNDLKEIEQLPDVSEVSPDMENQGIEISANGKEIKGMLFGINSSYFRIQKLKLLYGRFLTSTDDENHVRATVISYETAQKFFGKINVVGSTLKIFGETYNIVGVLEKAEGTFFGFLLGDQPRIYIPISCYSRIPELKFNGYPALLVSGKPGASANELKTELSEYFYKRFDKDQDAYEVTTQEEMSSILGSVTAGMGVVFGAVAAISLLVGGIGIMNIMLVSVTERTKEIGIRKAIGASTSSILLQFLIEAFVISLVGCLLGLFFSYLTIALANFIVQVLDIQVSFHIPLTIIIVSAVFALLVGLVFGIYPASKAAKKKPIEALRYDG